MIQALRDIRRSSERKRERSEDQAKTIPRKKRVVFQSLDYPSSKGNDEDELLDRRPKKKTVRLVKQVHKEKTESKKELSDVAKALMNLFQSRDGDAPNPKVVIRPTNVAKHVHEETASPYDAHLD